MTITQSHLTNGASWPRELKPTVLMVVHITDNMGSAGDQVHYANRAGSQGPSAHDYLDPDGSGIEALDPASRCAWSNGDVQAPNLSIPTVKAAVMAHVNPNRIAWREVECVGDGAHPVTDAQLAQVARFVAADSRATGLPVSRSTVTTHADWNSVSRNNCAFRPSVREARLADVIAMANAILHPEPKPPAPDPSPVRYTVAINGRTPVYLHQTDARPLTYVRRATFRCARGTTPDGRIWYRVLSLGSGRKSAHDGRYMPASSTMTVTRED